MMRYLNLLLVAVLVAALAACGGSEQLTEDGYPVWYLNTPSDTEEELFSIGEGSSNQRRIARQQATVDAQNQMAQKLGIKVESLQKLFEEEIATDEAANYHESFTNATRTITEQELTGGSITEMEIFERDDSGEYEVFILYSLPVGDARDELQNALSQDEELYVRFRESQAFDELENNLERLGED